MISNNCNRTAVKLIIGTEAEAGLCGIVSEVYCKPFKLGCCQGVKSYVGVIWNKSFKRIWSLDFILSYGSLCGFGRHNFVCCS